MAHLMSTDDASRIQASQVRPICIWWFGESLTGQAHAGGVCPPRVLPREPKLREIAMRTLQARHSPSHRARGTHSRLNMVHLNPPRIEVELPRMDVTVEPFLSGSFCWQSGNSIGLGISDVRLIEGWGSISYRLLNTLFRRRDFRTAGRNCRFCIQCQCDWFSCSSSYLGPALESLVANLLIKITLWRSWLFQSWARCLASHHVKLSHKSAYGVSLKASIPRVHWPAIAQRLLARSKDPMTGSRTSVWHLCSKSRFIATAPAFESNSTAAKGILSTLRMSSIQTMSRVKLRAVSIAAMDASWNIGGMFSWRRDADAVSCSSSRAL